MSSSELEKTDQPELSMLSIIIEQTLANFAMVAHARGYHPDEVFYVERHFLRSHLEHDTNRISARDAGLGNFDANCTCTCCHNIVVQSFRLGATEPSHTYTFSYFGGQNGDFGPSHGLIITDEKSNTLYWRDVGQKPETEWLLNEMARDITDANGNFIFDGDPYGV